MIYPVKVVDFSRREYIWNTEKLLVWEEKVLVFFGQCTEGGVYFRRDVFMMVFVHKNLLFLASFFYLASIALP